ncbi:unnamed protein product [Effrenium voratum]|nr:unnamed protein product [Effrenium voratum]
MFWKQKPDSPDATRGVHKLAPRAAACSQAQHGKGPRSLCGLSVVCCRCRAANYLELLSFWVLLGPCWGNACSVFVSTLCSPSCSLMPSQDFRHRQPIGTLENTCSTFSHLPHLQRLYHGLPSNPRRQRLRRFRLQLFLFGSDGSGGGEEGPDMILQRCNMENGACCHVMLSFSWQKPGIVK